MAARDSKKTSSTISTRASVVLRMWEMPGPRAASWIGTSIAPSLRIPNHAYRNSDRLPIMIATRSPSLTPRSLRPAATCPARSASLRIGHGVVVEDGEHPVAVTRRVLVDKCR